VTIVLERGKHALPEEGMCLMEAVSFVVGEPFSDHPSCVSPFLASFGRSLNDILPDKSRQQLIPLIPWLIATGNPEKDQQDGLRCAHWLITHWLPAWLDLVPELKDRATALRGLPAPKSWSDIGSWEQEIDTTKNAATHVRLNSGGTNNESTIGATYEIRRIAWELWILSRRTGDHSKEAKEAWRYIWSIADTIVVNVNIVALNRKRSMKPITKTLQEDTVNLFIEFIKGRHPRRP
jgi:hypothetical protein